MKVFKDFEITGSDEEIERLIQEVFASLPEGWKRDTDAERRSEELALNDVDTTYVITRRQSDLPTVGIHLVWTPGTLEVPNIVPLETGQLSFDQYNQVVDELHDLVDGCELGHLQIRVSPGDVDIEDVISEQAARLLRAFCNLANKATGSAHPADRRRWLQFISEEHRDRSMLDGNMLRRALIEQFDWPEARASQLVSEYEFGRELLKEHDTCR